MGTGLEVASNYKRETRTDTSASLQNQKLTRRTGTQDFLE
jgi:hypothetical protein